MIANQRGLILIASQLQTICQARYTITFCDHIKNLKQILREYDRINGSVKGNSLASNLKQAQPQKLPGKLWGKLSSCAHES